MGDYVTNKVHGFVLDADGQFITIDEPNVGFSTVIFGINDRGEIVGSYIDAITKRNHGFYATCDKDFD